MVSTIVKKTFEVIDALGISFTYGDIIANFMAFDHMFYHMDNYDSAVMPIKFYFSALYGKCGGGQFDYGPGIGVIGHILPPGDCLYCQGVAPTPILINCNSGLTDTIRDIINTLLSSTEIRMQDVIRHNMGDIIIYILMFDLRILMTCALRLHSKDRVHSSTVFELLCTVLSIRGMSYCHTNYMPYVGKGSMLCKFGGSTNKINMCVRATLIYGCFPILDLEQMRVLKIRFEPTMASFLAMLDPEDFMRVVEAYKGISDEERIAFGMGCDGKKINHSNFVEPDASVLSDRSLLKFCIKWEDENEGKFIETEKYKNLRSEAAKKYKEGKDKLDKKVESQSVQQLQASNQHMVAAWSSESERSIPMKFTKVGQLCDSDTRRYDSDEDVSVHGRRNRYSNHTRSKPVNRRDWQDPNSGSEYSPDRDGRRSGRDRYSRDERSRDNERGRDDHGRDNDRDRNSSRNSYDHTDRDNSRRSGPGRRPRRRKSHDRDLGRRNGPSPDRSSDRPRRPDRHNSYSYDRHSPDRHSRRRGRDVDRHSGCDHDRHRRENTHSDKESQYTDRHTDRRSGHGRRNGRHSSHDSHRRENTHSEDTRNDHKERRHKDRDGRQERRQGKDHQYHKEERNSHAKVQGKHDYEEQDRRDGYKEQEKRTTKEDQDRASQELDTYGYVSQHKSDKRYSEFDNFSDEEPPTSKDWSEEPVDDYVELIGKFSDLSQTDKKTTYPILVKLLKDITSGSDTDSCKKLDVDKERGLRKQALEVG